MNLNIAKLKYLDNLVKEDSYLSKWAICALKWDSVEIHDEIYKEEQICWELILKALKEKIS